MYTAVHTVLVVVALTRYNYKSYSCFFFLEQQQQQQQRQKEKKSASTKPPATGNTQSFRMH